MVSVYVVYGDVEKKKVRVDGGWRGWRKMQLEGKGEKITSFQCIWCQRNTYMVKYHRTYSP